jgi:CRISPR type III-A-associated RAMP protein Csm4
MDSSGVDGLIPQTRSASGKRNDPLWQKRARVEISGKAKKIDEAEYLSERLFSQVVWAQLDSASIWRSLVDTGSGDDDIESISNCLLTKAERDLVSPLKKPDQFWTWNDVQRNTIDRVAGGTASGLLFFSHDLVFDRRYAGAWFALRSEEEVLKELLIPALRYLQDTGIGGDRSAGKGQFEIIVTEEPVELPEAEDGNCVMLLSRCIPAAGEFDFNGRPLAYRLATIRPKHESRLSGGGHREYKGLLRLFEPGSILPAEQSKAIYGMLARVLDSAEVEGRQVWHNGKAIAVSARISETGDGGSIK